MEYRLDRLGTGDYAWVIRTDEAEPFVRRRDGGIGLHFPTHPRSRDAMMP